ncbi:UDP-N-acetylmuramate dehydrogenase [bacterium]|nr:UDP-N-acetylmuramate dehydrogenase [bacterium]
MKLPPFIRRAVPLAPLTAYQIGGPAQYYTAPEDRDNLLKALHWAENEKVETFILGAGTNLLVSDRGFDGLIVHLHKFLDQVKVDESSGVWTAGAGVKLTPFVRQTAQAGFAGVEALIGIPGTLGGALKMNAGAFSQEISNTLLSLEIIDENQSIESMKPEDVGFDYRLAPGLDNKIVISAAFQLQQDDAEKLMQHVREITALRRNRQPLQWPSCGSVFKRPEADFAGRLIEAAKLKGYTVGQAQIPEKHANFIINLGGAKAGDVLSIIKTVKQRVFELSGISLKREVILIGFTDEELIGS